MLLKTGSAVCDCHVGDANAGRVGEIGDLLPTGVKTEIKTEPNSMDEQ